MYFAAHGGLDRVEPMAEAYLGFDGVANRINLVANVSPWNSATNLPVVGNYTINAGTALIGDLVAPLNGDRHNGWTALGYERGLLSNLAAQPDRAAPTAVLWLHNEFDATDPTLAAEMWMSAVPYDASLLRGTVGQDVPYLFVDAIPYTRASASGNQAIELGMATLSADPGFHATIAGRIPDADMSIDGSGNSGAFGGPHMNATDVDLLTTASPAPSRSVLAVCPAGFAAGPRRRRYRQSRSAGGSGGGCGWPLDQPLLTVAHDHHFGAGATIQVISVQVSGDIAVEADEGLRVTLTGPVGASAQGTIRNDDLAPQPQNLTLTGTAGGETLLGGAGTDTISGLGGNDLLVGGTGNDRLDSGARNDTLTGGTGKDLFHFGPLQAGHDVVTDFGHAEGDVLNGRRTSSAA